MGIFDRAKRAISSNVNAMLDKAEDPRKLVELTLDEMKEQIGRARQDVITAVATEKQLRKQCDELKSQMDKWEQRAVLAVKAGDDALAREALKQKARIAEQLQGTEKHREEQLGVAYKLRDELATMERRHAELAAKKGTIAAKTEIAKAGGGAEALGAQGGSNAFQAFRDMEEKIEQGEAEAVAMRELQDDDMKAAELESKFRRLELDEKTTTTEGGVEDELAALKKRVRIK
ncbi:MAG: PspA/IM30 family protein [Deltaproteobacteria bacterium]|nr:PspA/IM30 family protein [Deltaproteobacteria bacterium]